MQEQFSYSLMASGLGILIVFSILVLLSCLMIVIRKLSDGGDSKKSAAPKPSKAAKGAPKPEVPLPVLVAAAAAASGIEVDTPQWLPAAVAAFIAAEEDEAVAPRASNWHSSFSAKYDPWVANNKLTKTAPGA